MKTDIESHAPGFIKIKHGFTSVESAIIISILKQFYDEAYQELIKQAPFLKHLPVRNAKQIEIDILNEIEQYEEEVKNV